MHHQLHPFAAMSGNGCSREEGQANTWYLSETPHTRTGIELKNNHLFWLRSTSYVHRRHMHWKENCFFFCPWEVSFDIFVVLKEIKTLSQNENSFRDLSVWHWDANRDRAMLSWSDQRSTELQPEWWRLPVESDGRCIACALPPTGTGLMHPKSESCFHGTLPWKTSNGCQWNNFLLILKPSLLFVLI